MLQHLIFFFKQFNSRGPIGTLDYQFEINRTMDVSFER